MSMTSPEAKALFEQQTTAEQFVDDLTFLRMLRVQGDEFDQAYLGKTGTQLSNTYGTIGTHVDNDPGWLALGVDATRSFVDGSVAIRYAATRRWEVYRAW